MQRLRRYLNEKGNLLVYAARATFPLLEISLFQHREGGTLLTNRQNFQHNSQP